MIFFPNKLSFKFSDEKLNWKFSNKSCFVTNATDYPQKFNQARQAFLEIKKRSFAKSSAFSWTEKENFLRRLISILNGCDNNFMQTSFIFYLDCIVEIESTCFFFENFPLCTIPPSTRLAAGIYEARDATETYFPGYLNQKRAEIKRKHSKSV